MANEKHILLTFGGDYVDSPNAAEVWQNSLRFALVFGSIDPVGSLPNNWEPVADDINRTETDWTITGNWNVVAGAGGTFQPDDFLNDQVAPAVDAWLGTSGISDGIRATWAKVSPIGTTGRAVPAPPYATGSPCLLEWTSAYPTGDDGANLLPLQNSVVCSHRTSQTGRHGRGRMYRAGVSANANDSSGRIGSTYTAFFLDAQITLLESLAVSTTGPGAFSLQPIITGAPWNRYAVINQVRVGDRMDTQRRRRNALDETYVSDTPTYP